MGEACVFLLLTNITWRPIRVSDTTLRLTLFHAQVFPVKEESPERHTSPLQAVSEERWWAANWARNSRPSTTADHAQSEREIPSKSNVDPSRTESRVRSAKSLLSTEEDGVSMLRRSLEIRKTALKFRSQWTHPTVKSPNWSLTNQEGNSSLERIDPTKQVVPTKTRMIEQALISSRD